LNANVIGNSKHRAVAPARSLASGRPWGWVDIKAWPPDWAALIVLNGGSATARPRNRIDCRSACHPTDFDLP